MADCGAGVQANVHYMLLRVFDTFDADGDGFLSKDEIYAMKEASGRRSFGAEHPHTSYPSFLLHFSFVDHANLSTTMGCGVAGRVWSEAEHEFFCKTHGTRKPLSAFARPLAILLTP